MMLRQPVESRIQSAVYGLDVGGGLRLLRVTGGALFLLVLLLVYTATQFRGLKDAEAMDAAQIGRNLMARGAFVTQCVRPASMGRLDSMDPGRGARVLHHPDLYHPPLYPWVLSLGFRAFPRAFEMERPGGVFVPEQWVIVPINHLFLLLSGLALYLIARELFGHKRALWGAGIFGLSQMMWSDSISGTGITMAMFFLLASFYFALRAVSLHGAGRARAAWAGILLSAGCGGLAVLTRYAAAAALPGVILYLAVSLGRRRWAAAAVFCLVGFLCVLPWMVRNQRVGGSPFGMAPRAALHDSALSQDDALERRLDAAVSARSALAAIQRKTVSRLTGLYRNRILGFGEGLMFPFFLSSFFFRFVRRDVNLFRWSLGLALLGVVLAAAVFGEGAFRMMHALWPLVILYGLAFFFLLLDRLQLRLHILRLGVTVLVVLLSSLSLLITLLPPRPGVPYPPYFSPFIQSVTRLLEPNEVLMTDMPWATAWYGNRTSIYLPTNLDGFYEINDFHQRVSAIYFTTLTRDKPYIRELRTGPYQSWFPILEGRLPGDFPLLHGFPLNNLDQIFITDRPRWGSERPR